jgi:putative ABC transport system permease protein
MAWRYVAHNRVKTLVLLLSITLIAFLPAALRVLVRQSERELTARAAATPLLIGTRGSPLELVLNSIYFAPKTPEPIPYAEVGRIAETKLALPIPLSVRFRAREAPIVGTSLDYLELRGLRVATGDAFARLGDCVIGAGLARELGIGPGDHVISSPENVFDLAGVYPLKMRVTGVLDACDCADDDAVLVDVKTTWIIEGLAHGHEDLAAPQARGRVLERDGDRIVANASVVQYNEITDDNIGSFHFHGDVASFPLTAIIAVPPDGKSATILRGRYETGDGAQQIVRPVEVVDELLATVFTVEEFVVAALAIAGVTTLALAALVFALSLRLRRGEIATMVKIGGTRARIASILGAEIVLVIVASVGLAAALTWLTGQFASELVRALLIR